MNNESVHIFTTLNFNKCFFLITSEINIYLFHGHVPSDLAVCTKATELFITIYLFAQQFEQMHQNLFLTTLDVNKYLFITFLATWQYTSPKTLMNTLLNVHVTDAPYDNVPGGFKV
jgi:hypothetical protein